MLSPALCHFSYADFSYFTLVNSYAKCTTKSTGKESISYKFYVKLDLTSLAFDKVFTVYKIGFLVSWTTGKGSYSRIVYFQVSPTCKSWSYG